MLLDITFSRLFAFETFPLLYGYPTHYVIVDLSLFPIHFSLLDAWLCEVAAEARARHFKVSDCRNGNPGRDLDK